MKGDYSKKFVLESKIEKREAEPPAFGEQEDKRSGN